MAEFESSTFGKMSGRLGKVVAVKRNGKNFLRECNKKLEIQQNR